ncbi:MAG: DUF45 domain-containing protein [Candidatus Caenarcaniphilales bacterium]|jgi:hypothetical protein|nr:DUF45 domain-containing protein [Candidatus Caenarcaniphilales bacterium]
MTPGIQPRIITRSQVTNNHRDLTADQSATPNETIALITASDAIRPSSKHLPATAINGVITDQKLIEWHFKRQGWDATPIATDEFIGKSKNEYNSAWLTREIAQNFVDHNKKAPGTLNGVSISETSNDGITQFVIKGNWTIDKPTGLVGLQSKKSQDRYSAGGNGIGLKQVAVRLLRDFAVKKFQIQGASWNLDYDLVKKDVVNADLEAAGIKERVEDDWLVGKMSACTERNDCSYIIETQDQELIQALRSLKEVGVCEENPYLDQTKASSTLIKEGKGKILWLPLNDKGEMQNGRLFINGQVMSYRDKGSCPQDFWTATEGVSIQLDNMEYDMNIDRPQVASYRLETYLEHLFKGMTNSELIQELKASEHLWASDALKKTSSSLSAANAVISKLISTLRYSGSYDANQYSEYFGDKKYLASEIGIPDDQIKKLEQQGYVICPSQFAGIGMPKVSTALSNFDQALNTKPSHSQHESRRLAEKHGVRVNYLNLENLSSAKELFQDMLSKLGTKIKSINQKSEGSSTFRIYIDAKISVDDIFMDDLACHSQRERENSTEGQNLLHYLRGAFFSGMSKHYFKSTSLSQGEYVVNHDTSFNANRQRLIARNVPCPSSEGLFIELQVNDYHLREFEALINTFTNTKKPNSTSTFFQPNDPKSISIIDYKTQLEAIPVQAKENEGLVVNGAAIKKQVRLSPEEIARIAKLEQAAPGISAAIEQLDSLIPEINTNQGSSDTRLESYLNWRNSNHFYGQLDLDYKYLSGRNLVQIINAATKAKVNFIVAEIESGSNIPSQINNALKAIINKACPSDTQVQDDFEIIMSPSQSHLAKLTLMRNYVAYTTGYIIPNDTFLYQGTGSYGINIGQKAIGLNTALLDVPFEEAIQVLFHEVAHNKSMQHDLDFRNALERIVSTERKVLGGIIGKTITQTPLNDLERKIAGIRDEWERL